MNQMTKEKPVLLKTDRNGTKHWQYSRCPKCGGSGYIAGYGHIDGARCWKCNATGVSVRVKKEYTPEHAAKLESRRLAKERSKNLANRETQLSRMGFNSEGFMFIVLGNTYPIKDDLKAAGAKYSPTVGWHFKENPSQWETVALSADLALQENPDNAFLFWRDNAEVSEILKNLREEVSF